MKAKNGLCFLVALLLDLTLMGCGSPQAAATDYSMASHWLALPVAPVPEKNVDVFYLYPTAWTDKSADPGTPHICAIDDPTMLVQAPAAFARQATAFAAVGNIYAPYYRQDNGSPVDRLNVISGVPTMDGVAAFDYYVKHYNNGRPFILVGHSQGATVLSNLLSGYMKENPDVYKNMVAAYVIGHPVTDTYLAKNPHLKFATGPDDTGVIVSYNTESPDVAIGTNPVLYGMDAIVGTHILVINPLNWRRDETPAALEESLGSFMPIQLTPQLVWGEAPPYADAAIDLAKGVLICSSVTPEEIPFMDAVDRAKGFLYGIYHSFDIPFYYYSLQANAQNRVSRFLASAAIVEK